MVLPEVQEVKDVGMPRLQVDGKCPGAFVPSLVHVAGSVVVNPQHGHQSIRRAVGLGDRGSGSR